MASATDKRLPDRFWVKTQVEDRGYETPCLTWIGSKTTAGYGRFAWQGKGAYAHRVAYETLVGPILQGLVIDHLCRNRACVNVNHLEPVTQGVNALRGVGVMALNAAKTHCKRGHKFTEENTRIGKTGNRNCRECLAIQHAKWNDKRRGRQVRNRPPKPPRPPRWASRTHCSKGHLLAEAGIYVDKTGKPYCRECIRIRSRRAYWRKRNAAIAEGKVA